MVDSHIMGCSPPWCPLKDGCLRSVGKHREGNHDFSHTLYAQSVRSEGAHDGWATMWKCRYLVRAG